MAMEKERVWVLVARFLVVGDGHGEAGCFGTVVEMERIAVALDEASAEAA